MTRPRSNQGSLFPAAQNTLRAPLETHLDALTPAWRRTLAAEALRPVIQRLSVFLHGRLAAGAEIYPRHPFRALEYVQPDTAQVIILGQDPYHGPNQAQGLAFSVPDACPAPPSLRNIFKELALEHPELPLRRRHDLADWAQQGVLLLNAVLTVESRQPASHARQGWEAVTDAIIQRVAISPQPKVFMLWGAYAQRKAELLEGVQAGSTKILKANHPSPLSAQRPPQPFIGCGHFEQANIWLTQQGCRPIRWNDPPHGG